MSVGGDDAKKGRDELPENRDLPPGEIQDFFERLKSAFASKPKLPGFERLMSILGPEEVHWLAEALGNSTIKSPEKLFQYPVGARIRQALFLELDVPSTDRQRPDWAPRLDVIVEEWLVRRSSTIQTQKRLNDIVEELGSRQTSETSQDFADAVASLQSLFADPEYNRDLGILREQYQALFSRQIE